MRKNENNKAKKEQAFTRQATLWKVIPIIAASTPIFATTENTITHNIVGIARINVIPILIKLFNVLYFKHSFGKEFNYPYSISLVTILFLFVVTALIEKEEK